MGPAKVDAALASDAVIWVGLRINRGIALRGPLVVFYAALPWLLVPVMDFSEEILQSYR